MASRFLSDCEAVSIRLNQAPKGPVRKLFESSWPDSNGNREAAGRASATCGHIYQAERLAGGRLYSVSSEKRISSELSSEDEFRTTMSSIKGKYHE